MARTADPKLRTRILNECIHAAMKVGIHRVTLARLSMITGVSQRMLIYHFGSVEQLVTETLRGVADLIYRELHENLAKDSKLDSRRAILSLWRYSISSEMRRPIRNYFYLYSMAIEDRSAYRDFIQQSVSGWIQWVRNELSNHEPKFSEAELTLILAVMRGLMLDYWATRDLKRTTEAMETFMAVYPFGREKKLSDRTRLRRAARGGQSHPPVLP